MYFGTTPKAPSTPQNVKVDISSGVKVSWNRPSNCIGYKVEVYNTSNEKVKDINVNKPNRTETKITGLATGSYTVRVYARGVNDMISGYSTASFSCRAEATSFDVYPEYAVIEVRRNKNI